MMSCTAIYQRMGSTGIITKHTAYTTAVAGRGFWTKVKTEGLKRNVQFITNNPGLYPCPFLFLVYFKYLIPLLDIHNNTGSHHLTSYRCASSTGNKVGIQALCFCNKGLNVCYSFLIGYSIGHLTVGGSVR